METISNEALAAARAKLDAAESQRENILLFHIANGVNICLLYTSDAADD